MGSSILSEVEHLDLRTGLSNPPALSSQLASGLSALAPAQRAGAQRLCALARSSPPSMSAVRWLRALNRTSRGQPNPVENGPKPGMSGAHLAALKMAAYFSAAPKRSRKFRTSRAIPASYEAAHKGRPDDPGLPVRGFA